MNNNDKDFYSSGFTLASGSMSEKVEDSWCLLDYFYFVVEFYFLNFEIFFDFIPIEKQDHNRGYQIAVLM